MAPLQIDTALIKRASLFLNVLDNKTRLKILKTIHLNGKMTVTEIYTQLNLEQPVTSQHLQKLKEGHFVITDRKKKFIYYSIDYTSLEKVMGLIGGLLAEPVYTKYKKPIRLLLSDYKFYVMDLIDSFKPIRQETSYEGMQAWLNSFSGMLKEYNDATLKKKKRILDKAYKSKKIDTNILNRELENIRINAIDTYIKKHKF